MDDGAGRDDTAELSLDAVLGKVVELARTLVGARYGALSVVNDDGSIQTFLTSGVTAEQRGGGAVRAAEEDQRLGS